MMASMDWLRRLMAKGQTRLWMWRDNARLIIAAFTDDLEVDDER